MVHLTSSVISCLSTRCHRCLHKSALAPLHLWSTIPLCTGRQPVTKRTDEYQASGYSHYYGIQFSPGDSLHWSWQSTKQSPLHLQCNRFDASEPSNCNPDSSNLGYGCVFAACCISMILSAWPPSHRWTAYPVYLSYSCRAGFRLHRCILGSMPLRYKHARCGSSVICLTYPCVL